jgi:hypothetical protein
MASEQVAKIEWLVPQGTVARGRFHTTELNDPGGKRSDASSSIGFEPAAGRHSGRPPDIPWTSSGHSPPPDIRRTPDLSTCFIVGPFTLNRNLGRV